MQKLNVKQLHVNGHLPTRAHETDAGLDLYCSEEVVLMGGSQANVRTGIAIQIPPGYVGIIKDRSSMAKNKHVQVLAGVIDSGYNGEVQVVLRNHAHTLQRFNAGTRIAQLLLIPIGLHQPQWVAEFPNTERGTSGFGSTGE